MMDCTCGSSVKDKVEESSGKQPLGGRRRGQFKTNLREAGVIGVEHKYLELKSVSDSWHWYQRYWIFELYYRKISYLVTTLVLHTDVHFIMCLEIL
jgi:hypothetical protein